MQRLVLGAVLLALASLTAGCAAFPAEKTASAQVPDLSGKAYKPTAYLDVKFFQGKPGDSGAVEVPAAKPIALNAVAAALATNSPFSRVTYDAFEQEKVDHVVRLHFYNYGNTGAATLSGLLTGFSMFIIPGAGTDNYTLVAGVDKPSSGAEQRSNDSITTWFGIWFLPMASKTPQKAVATTLESMTRDGLRQLIQSNQLRFTPPATTESAAAPAT